MAGDRAGKGGPLALSKSTRLDRGGGRDSRTDLAALGGCVRVNERREGQGRADREEWNGRMSGNRTPRLRRTLRELTVLAIRNGVAIGGDVHHDALAFAGTADQNSAIDMRSTFDTYSSRCS
jgi:hypothetical protein